MPAPRYSRSGPGRDPTETPPEIHKSESIKARLNVTKKIIVFGEAHN
jgi:hypothetical protein